MIEHKTLVMKMNRLNTDAQYELYELIIAGTIPMPAWVEERFNQIYSKVKRYPADVLSSVVSSFVTKELTAAQVDMILEAHQAAYKGASNGR